MLGDTIGHRGQPGHFRAVIEHDIDPMPAQVGREIGLIERAPFLHPAVELVEPQAAHAAGFGQHGVEDGGVGMQLHVAGNAATGALEGVQLGVVLPAPVGLDDGDGRAGGVVVEGDPADRARLPSSCPPSPFLARPICASMSFMTLPMASWCAWWIIPRSASVGAKAHATETDFGAENVRST